MKEPNEYLVLGEAGLVRAVFVHPVDLAVFTDAARKGDLRAVRRPVGLIGPRRVLGDITGTVLLALGLGLHHVDLVVAAAITLEGYLGSVRRPSGMFVDRAVLGEASPTVAVAVRVVVLDAHHEDVGGTVLPTTRPRYSCSPVRDGF